MLCGAKVVSDIVDVGLRSFKGPRMFLFGPPLGWLYNQDQAGEERNDEEDWPVVFFGVLLQV